MSEQDEQRPLTRRERRLREMAETGALDLSEVNLTGEALTSPAAAEPSDEPEISPLNPDGTPRSRREMRQLREQALAERAAQSSEAAEPADDVEIEESAEAEPADDGKNEESAEAAEPEVEESAEEVAESESADNAGPAEAAEPESAEAVSEPIEDEAAGAEVVEAAAAESGTADAVQEAPETVSAEETDDAADATEPPLTEALENIVAGATSPELPDGAVSGELDFDSLITPPTEPYTVADLHEAEGAENAGEAVAAAAEADSDEAADDAAETVVTAADAPVADAAEEAPEPVADTAGEPEAEAASQAEAKAEPLPETVQFDTQAAANDREDGEESASSDPESANPEQKTTYSFPDIAPPEEWRSVFDDPAGRNVPSQGGQNAQGDFDDLISRAVAQEGVSSTAGTSALILPSMPEDTGGLAGPIGATGDLYVTGSLKLPKSMGETGGHSALHDSIEVDPIAGDSEDPTHLTSEGPAPVSARHAVSARGTSGLSVVAKPAKEKNKLPLVLSLTGGGLLIVVVGLGIWGYSNGMFG